MKKKQKKGKEELLWLPWREWRSKPANENSVMFYMVQKLTPKAPKQRHLRFVRRDDEDGQTDDTLANKYVAFTW